MTRSGLAVRVPESDAEDVSPKFDIGDAATARQYYLDNGYVVFRHVLAKDVCTSVMDMWDSEIKPSRDYIYRQDSAKPEHNSFNDRGFVSNPILNIQSMNPRKFPKFRNLVVDRVFRSEGLIGIFRSILDDEPRIVQSMYFEGNTATSEHQDSYYLDSDHIGSMVAAWIALEDIDAGAGRFFVCPKSHRMAEERQSAENNISDGHHRYLEKILDRMRAGDLEIRAPKLDAGDVLLWNSKTIHGSLRDDGGVHARASITCHAIASSHRFLQFHARIIDPVCDEYDGVKIWRPKDQAIFRNRLVLGLEVHFPALFYYLKSQAIKFMVRRNSR